MTPVIRVACLSGYREMAESLNLDVDAALAHVNLSPKILTQQDMLIPYYSVVRLLEYSASVTKHPDFGLRLSQRQGIDILGPLAVLLRHAPTMKESMRLGAQYLFVYSNAIRTSIEPVVSNPEQLDLTWEIASAHRSPAAQTIELALGVLTELIKQQSRGCVRPIAIHLPHQQISSVDTYFGIFGCECRFGMPKAAMRFELCDLERPLAEHDPLLQQMAQAYLDQHFIQPNQRISDRVRSVVRQLLGSAPLTQIAVAETLSLHPRTLQRYLSNEGRTFESIVDEVRRNRLSQLLAQRETSSLTQIALVLGYSEQAALTRSCKRWFGCSPRELRQRLENAAWDCLPR